MKDRRKKWVKRHLREGRCSKCGERRLPGSKRYCLKHLEDDRERKRVKLEMKPWRIGGPGRPPINASALYVAQQATITIPSAAIVGASTSPTTPSGANATG